MENYIALKDYKNAILSALAINRPDRLLSLLRSAYGHSKEDSSIEPEVILKDLSASLLGKLLSHVRVWNAVLGNAEVAQAILHTIVKLRRTDSVLDSLKAAVETDQHMGSPKEFLDSTIPYTERHLKRLRKLEQDSWLLDLVLDEMASGMLPSDGALEAMDQT